MDEKEVKEKQFITGVGLLILSICALTLGMCNIVTRQPNAMFITPLNVALSVGYFMSKSRKRITGWLWAMVAVFNFISGIFQLI